MKSDFDLNNYNYSLPQTLIAQYPANPAHGAKLLVIEEKN